MTPPPCPSVIHPGEEYRPLIFYQETTAHILVQALNPLDYRKWRNKSAYWKALKVFKVGGGAPEPGSRRCDSSRPRTLATQPCLLSEEGRGLLGSSQNR